MASVRLPLLNSEESYSIGEVQVTIINPKNNKSAQMSLAVDTGTPYTAISSKSARTLGINLESGTKSEEDFYIHQLSIKIGTLRPITTPVEVPSSKLPFDYTTLGLYTLKQFKNVSFTKGSIIFEQQDATPVTTIAKKNAILVDLYTSFYGYPRWYTKRI